MPPPKKPPELPDSVQPLTVSRTLLAMPPPPPKAELSDSVQPLTVSGPLLAMPPPMKALLPDTVQSLTVSVPLLTMRPESASEVTDRPTCAGIQRPSSASSVGWKLGRLRGIPCCFRLRSQEGNHMMLVLSSVSLRWNENAIAFGAQTERRGLAGSASS